MNQIVCKLACDTIWFISSTVRSASSECCKHELEPNQLIQPFKINKEQR